MRRRIPKLTAEQEAEFWALVEKDETTGCSVWKGEGAGYTVGGLIFKAGRVAYRVQAKQQPPGKLGRTCSNTLCIAPEHTRAWPPKVVEKRAPDPHMREVGRAVSLLLREQRVLAERVMGLAHTVRGIEEALHAMVLVGERVGARFNGIESDIAALRELVAALTVAPQPTNGAKPPVDELAASLMHAYEQSVGVIDHPGDADYEALRTAFDAAIGLARKTDSDAARVFSGWLGRFARLCADNAGMERSPRNFLRTLEALAPEALGQHHQ